MPLVIVRLLAFVPVVGLSYAAFAEDQPQWGQAWNRNLVSPEKNLPSTFDPVSRQNIKWVVSLGTESHSTPVIAGGRVYIGTNNGEPRDPKHKGDRGVLMCFEEETGKLLWQLVSPKREEDPFHDWPNSGISSPATVEGDRVYVVSNRGEVLCLDARGLKNGNDGPFRDEAGQMTPRGTNAPPEKIIPGELDADIIWLTDLTHEAGIWSHDAAHSSIIIDGDFLYLNSGTGVDNTHKKIRTPEAPSLLALHKKTGRILARDFEGIAPNIFHCTWSAPSMAEVNGQKRIFFAGGNGIIYGFDALRKEQLDGAGVAKFKKVFEFDFDPSAPKEDIHRYNSNRRESPSNIYGMPVFAANKLYVAGGGDVFWGKNEAWLKCIDATGNGDVTKSAEVWKYPLGKHVLSTPAVFNGMVFIADTERIVHCVDAKNGKELWKHDCNGDFWASPYVADEKIFIGSRRGDFWVFAATAEKQVLFSHNFRTPISATATAANGVLYVGTMTQLYAICFR
jgi:outer membrane protein assembly factor BamB